MKQNGVTRKHKGPKQNNILSSFIQNDSNLQWLGKRGERKKPSAHVLINLMIESEFCYKIVCIVLRIKISGQFHSGLSHLSELVKYFQTLIGHAKWITDKSWMFFISSSQEADVRK